MLSCEEVTEKSSALVDGELGLWETMRMRMHLAMCKGCAAFVSQMRAVRDLTSAPAPAKAPAPGDEARIDEILSRLHDRKQEGG